MPQVYVRFRGQVTGPFADTEVRNMLERELVTAAHELSTDRVRWVPARRGFALVQPQDAEGDDTESSDAQGDASWLDSIAAGPVAGMSMAGAPSARALPAKLALVAGLSCGAVLVYVSLVPVGWSAEGLTFWWNASWGHAIAGCAAMLLGVAAAAAALLEPKVRGMAMTALAGFGLFASLAVGLDGLLAALPAALAASASAAAGVLLATGLGDSKHRDRAWLVAGGVLALGVLLALVASVYRGSQATLAAEGRFAIVHGVTAIVTSAAWAGVLAVGLYEDMMRRGTRPRPMAVGRPTA